ncbi:hypothetical protein VTK26DRAFT_4542 [Humicola hyalothermophila]
MWRIKVGEDEPVRMGVLKAVSINEYAFRVVDELKYDTCCEVDIEDGVLYLQNTPAMFGTDTDYVAFKLMDRFFSAPSQRKQPGTPKILNLIQQCLRQTKHKRFAAGAAGGGHPQQLPRLGQNETLL